SHSRLLRSELTFISSKPIILPLSQKVHHATTLSGPGISKSLSYLSTVRPPGFYNYKDENELYTC
ncbi:hypothetical protein E4U56_006398, partial [Claviceps arundinis]